MTDGRVTYRDAGVDIDAANEAVLRMREHVRHTYTPGVLTDIGGFGGMFSLDALTSQKDQVLVSSIDGVGTKLKLAALLGKHDTIGFDLVNHCVNDILVHGARPLFMLDYLAQGKVLPAVVEQIVKGIANACREVDCALIGGETAEMPGLYAEGEYDLVGTVVGLVSRRAIVDGSKVRPRDAVVGLASSGMHTNGYSLARRVLLDGDDALSPYEFLPSIGRTLAEELMTPHRCYARALLPLLKEFDIHGMAHLTGGGFYDNIPRVLPSNCSVTIERRSWPVPPVFKLIQERGNVPEPEMYRAFNMGIGLVVIVASEQAPLLAHRLNASGESGYVIGDVHQGVREVDIV